MLSNILSHVFDVKCIFNLDTLLRRFHPSLLKKRPGQKTSTVFVNICSTLLKIDVKMIEAKLMLNEFKSV